MRIAIFLQKENFTDENMVQAYAFTVRDDVIISMGDEMLTVSSMKYLLSWLLARSINIVYTKYFQNEEIVKCLNRINVSVRSLDELKKNPLLNKFLLNE